jgi:hypothetical protein
MLSWASLSDSINSLDFSLPIIYIEIVRYDFRSEKQRNIFAELLV